MTRMPLCSPQCERYPAEWWRDSSYLGSVPLPETIHCKMKAQQGFSMTAVRLTWGEACIAVMLTWKLFGSRVGSKWQLGLVKRGGRQKSILEQSKEFNPALRRRTRRNAADAKVSKGEHGAVNTHER